MAGLTVYNQRILSGRKFRLLLISPACDPHQQVECHCFPFDLDSAPAYEALSYVWGKNSAETAINFNGSKITVGIALADALSRLRHPSSTRIIWADALCINQKDAEEKSHQVPMMGSIYSMARRVVVWLGRQDTFFSMTAKIMVHFIGTACRQYDYTRSQLQLPDNDERYESLEIPAEEFTPEGLQSLKHLFGRRWFRRIWCVQEICLAREAIVLYGDVEIPWEAVGLTASWIFDRTTGPGEKDALSSSLNKILSANADLLCDEDIKGSLLEVLQFFREFKATDPRDRVYGLLNLVTEKREIEALKVDYNKTRAQVYADTTLVIIRLYSRLTTLAWVFHTEDYDGEDEMRSWAPIWDDANPTAVLGYPERACPWSSCGSQLIKGLDESYVGYEQLRLLGVFYDTVIQVHDTMDSYNLEDPLTPGEQHPFVTTVRSFAEIDIYPDVNGQEHLRKLARTLTAAEVESTPVMHPSDTKAQEDFYNSFLDLLEWLTHLSSGHPEDAGTLDPTASEIRASAYYTCKLRRMFVMKNKSYGLGPQCMRAGDIVVVLYGGNTPYVLRPIGDKYLFLGQAYVDEIMHGQLVQEVSAGTRAEEEFCIR
ncbi:HET-domain-containing protein [Phaeosphaeriaceae sp. SRC1lsM3a]|nr:HET-domain-containing protein [Stagonospora sp. SRC1lsM3a]